MPQGAGNGKPLKPPLKSPVKRAALLLLVGLFLAILLAACGSDGKESVLRLPTGTPNSTSVAAQASPPPAATTTTAPPEATPTALPTTSPAPTPATAQATATATAQPAATAPPAEAPAKIDAAAELKVIKAAYDAINQHFYTQPDTAMLAQKGLAEAAKAFKVGPPPVLAWRNPANNWQLFEQQFQQMAAQTQVQLPQGEVAHRVANAMALAAGDLHTYFLDRKRTDAIQRMGRGDNTTLGFGLFFVLYQNGYYVQRLTTGSPGQVAGVKVGDRLIQFEGAVVNSTNFANLSNATEGRSYDFVFQPLGGSPPVTRKIEYKRYNVPTAEWHLVNSHIGFITLNAFHLDVATRLDEAIAALKEQGADSLVLDLRYNGGGYNFDKVAGRFVSDGTVLGKFVNRTGAFPVKARSEGKQVTPPLPLVVLIDRNSASASEIFSLAIRDFQAGTLLGGRSAGAIGTVAYWPLGDGTSLGVTAAVYETARGEKLNGSGITPDIAVTRTTEDILNGRDPQLEAAVKQLEEKAKVSH